MRKFLIMSLSMIFILFFGTMTGVQVMNEELGISHPEPFTISKKDDEEYKRVMDIEDLVEKKYRVEEIGRGNFFSEVGTLVADGTNQVSRSFLGGVMSFVQDVLNGV